MFLLDESFLEIKTVSNTKMVKNRGVFAKKDIQGGTVIGDYIGVVTAEDDEDEHKFGTYYIWYGKNTSIYGDPKIPGVHIINHSCMSNCGMIEHKTHLVYYALRKIFKGEELTVFYDLGLPGDDCNPCTHQCYCGTPLCTGTTHSAEDLTEPKDEKEDGSLYLKPGSTLPPLPKYPKKIRDSVNDNIYASLRKRAVSLDTSSFPSKKEIKNSIRNTGLPIYVSNLNTEIYGIHNSYIILKNKNPARK